MNAPGPVRPFGQQSTGQYLYENYLLIFGTVFAPPWRELTEESRSNWAKLELATRIDCTCHSDPAGRCVVHPIPAYEQGLHPRCQAFMSPGPPWYAAQCRFQPGHAGEHDCGTEEEAKAAWDFSIASSRGGILSSEEVYWHPKGCDCGNCRGGTMPVQVLTVTLPSANPEHRYFPAEWEVRPSANALKAQPVSEPEKSVNHSVMVFGKHLHSNDWVRYGITWNQREIEISDGVMKIGDRIFGGQPGTQWMLCQERSSHGSD